VTNSSGIARCRWQLPETPPVGADGGPSCLEVRARLLDSTLAAPAPDLAFSSRVSQASQVAYDPSACPPLLEAGVSTVQQAVDELCRNLGDAEPGIAVQAVRVLDDDIFIRNDQPLEPRQLARGLMIQCDREVDPRAFLQPETDFAVPAKPNFTVALDLPYPLGSDQNFWDFTSIVGFQEVVLRARVSAEGRFIRWAPHPETQRWLEGILFSRLMSPNAPITDRVLCRLALKGNFIWELDATKEPDFYLDGEVFGQPSDEGVVGLRLPSGNGRRGGDFEMWFWVAPAASETGLVLTATATGSVVAGSLQDASGAPLPGAAITLINSATGQRRGATTNTAGQYRFAEVANGRYQVQATVGGITATRFVVVGGILNPPIRGVAEIPGVGAVFSQRLEAAGIRTAREVADMDTARLAEILQLPAARAETIRLAARNLLG
ncbi:MAG: carboxypeptidase regulatory-like domain-containing protein, partial [Acidobacteria bacterium]|nr:carboxypeptidase regulatory-like domain-containing protein [Acidobacteriota bacterium]